MMSFGDSVLAKSAENLNLRLSEWRAIFQWSNWSDDHFLANVSAFDVSIGYGVRCFKLFQSIRNSVCCRNSQFPYKRHMQLMLEILKLRISESFALRPTIFNLLFTFRGG